MTIAKAPFDVQELVRRNTSGKCFICEFIRGNPDYRHTMVAETRQSVAFLNRYPTLFGSVLVAPRDHLEQVTGDFLLDKYLEIQRFVYAVAEGMRRILSPERMYIVSLGSQAANSHVHWQVAALPRGIPLHQQQYHALMHEHGVIVASEAESNEYVRLLEAAINAA